MSYVTDDRVPIEQRWGGWYISGVLGNQKHLGVAITPDTERFDTAAYPVPTSDVVALLTLEHQARMTNLITRVGWDTRIAEADNKMSAFSEQLDYEIGELVKYMTFAGESPLAGPIQGASPFAKDFTAQGPRDKQGRSLRDFDLQKKVFRYPVSYMIYNPAFDALPDAARSRIYRRLFDTLKTIDSGPEAIEILRQTKDGLPDYFRNSAPGHQLF
jgi:hypothetical protein